METYRGIEPVVGELCGHVLHPVPLTSVLWQAELDNGWGICYQLLECIHIW